MKKAGELIGLIFAAAVVAWFIYMGVILTIWLTNRILG